MHSIRGARASTVLLAALALLGKGCDGVPDVDQAGEKVVRFDLSVLHTDEAAAGACVSAAETIRLRVAVGGVEVEYMKPIRIGALADTMRARGIEGETILRFDILSNTDRVLYRGRQTVDVDADFSEIVFDPDSVEQVQPVLKVCAQAPGLWDRRLDLQEASAEDVSFVVVNQGREQNPADLAWTLGFEVRGVPCAESCVQASATGGVAAPGAGQDVVVAPVGGGARQVDGLVEGRAVADGDSVLVGRVRFEILFDAPLPVARADAFLVDPVDTLDVLGNDTVPYLDGTLLLVVDGPHRGEASLTGDGRRIVYRPDAARVDPDACVGHVVRDSLRYTLREGSRDASAPVLLSNRLIARPDTAETAQNASVLVRVLGNDHFNARPPCLRLALDTPPAHGTARVEGDSTILYTPNSEYTGLDSLTYRITEGDQEAAGAVRIRVGPTTLGPVAEDDTLAARRGVPREIPADTLLRNDTYTDRNALTLGLVGESRAELRPRNPCRVGVEDCVVHYLLASGTVETDFFVYRITEEGKSDEATVTVRFEPDEALQAVDDADSTRAGTPVVIDVLANDGPDPARLEIAWVASPGHGSAEREGRRIRYTPDPGFAGADRFPYGITDGVQQSTPATVVVRVVPEARNDAGSTFSGEPVVIDVQANDTPSDRTHVEIAVVEPPAPGAGSVDVVAGGIRYTPGDGFSGTASFAYALVARQGGLQSRPAEVTVQVTNTDFAWVEIPLSFPEACEPFLQDEDLLRAIRERVQAFPFEEDARWGVTSRSYLVPYAEVGDLVDGLTWRCPNQRIVEGRPLVDRCTTEGPAPLTEARDSLRFFDQLPAAFTAPGAVEPWRFTLQHLYPYPECFDIDRIRLER